jgi:hypothetical protein
MKMHSPRTAGVIAAIALTGCTSTVRLGPVIGSTNGYLPCAQYLCIAHDYLAEEFSEVDLTQYERKGPWILQEGRLRVNRSGMVYVVYQRRQPASVAAVACDKAGNVQYAYGPAQ